MRHLEREPHVDKRTQSEKYFSQNNFAKTTVMTGKNAKRAGLYQPSQ
jgi:hypothetical protein